MWDYRYWSSERGSGGSLWYVLCRSEKWYIENIRYSLFLQRKTEKGKKHLKNCHKYSTSTENMENENLTLKGKIVIFKTLAISKTVFQSLISTVPRHITNELQRIQKVFLWKNSSPEIKRETLYNEYKGGGLKNIENYYFLFLFYFLFIFCFFYLSIGVSFYTGKNILPERLNYHLAFCLNFYGTMKRFR